MAGPGGSLTEREPLRRQYEVAVAEYRFCVELNWDREKFFLGLNTAVLGGAAGLLKLEGASDLLLLPVFLVGVGLAVLGLGVVEKGREYVRVARVKTALLEDELGLHEPLGTSGDPLATAAIGTTAGMREVAEMRADPRAWVEKPAKASTVGHRVGLAFQLFALLHAVGALWVLALAAW